MISVLLVDDDALTLELHRTYLERMDGFRVVAECTGARAAVSAILERPPADGIDLVLLDMTMPVMSGDEAMDEIAALAPGVPVIASSGYDEKEAVRRFAKKPVAGAKVQLQSRNEFRGRGRACVCKPVCCGEQPGFCRSQA